MAKRKPKIISEEVIDGVKITIIAPNDPPKKALTAALPTRFRDTSGWGTYRAVRMH